MGDNNIHKNNSYKEFQIVPAFPEDAEALTKLAFESKGYWGYPEHWLESWRDQIEITPVFVQNNTVFKAIATDRKLLGCVGLEFEDEKWILAAFWVKPEIMGKGIGKALYQKIMTCAREKGAQIIQWESDPNAVGFYERMGAEKIDEKIYDLDGKQRVLPIMAQKLFQEGFFIRIARVADLPKLIELLQDDAFGSQREGGVDSAETYEKAFQEIDKDPNHSILIVEDKDEVIGMLQLSFIPNLTFTGAWRAQIEGVRVASSVRGKGIGSLLIEEAIARANKKKCHIVQLTTNNTRPEALNFYKKIGFQDTHIGLKLYLDE